MTDQIRNREKYMVAPTWDEISEYLTENKICMADFERAFNLGKGNLRSVKFKCRELPSRLWHIIYEKINFRDYLKGERGEKERQFIASTATLDSPTKKPPQASIQPQQGTKKEMPDTNINTSLLSRLTQKEIGQ